MLKSKIVRTIAIIVAIITVLAFTGGLVGNFLNKDVSVLPEDKKQAILEFDLAVTAEGAKITDSAVGEAFNKINSEIADFTDNDIVTLLKDAQISDQTKIVLLQMADKINNGKGIESSKKLESLLIKGVVSDEVRVNLINSLEVDSESLKATLADIITKESGAAVMRSAIKLEQSDALAALSVANKILNSPDEFNEDNLRAAISVKSDYFKELVMADSKKDVTDEKTEYINTCMNLFKNTTDKKLKNSAILGLMNMQDFNAVKAVLNDKNVDEAMKLACIYRNSDAFIKVIQNNPSVEDVEFILSALEKAPMKEVLPAIEEHLLNKKPYHSNRLINIVNMIKGGGVNADSSRFEGTPTSNWIE